VVLVVGIETSVERDSRRKPADDLILMRLASELVEVLGKAEGNNDDQRRMGRLVLWREERLTFCRRTLRFSPTMMGIRTSRS
jgi:hypothetical protein